MESIKVKTLVLFVFAMILTTEANIGDFDAVWQQRSNASKEAARKACHPNPLQVVSDLNHNVHKHDASMNVSRRNLKGQPYSGPCSATNPIDSCWRCDKNWDKNRMRLADCALGFGHHTTGGKGGKMYIVTDASDGDMVNPKPGTLRHAVIQREALWIIFSRSMVIRLNEELIMASDKTIDGRGVQVHIVNGAGITLQYVQNIIIHNLHIRDIKNANGGMIRDSVNHYGQRSKSDGDGISVFGSTNIWIDHVSMSNCMDGLIDVVEGSTAITISNCHFTHHNDVLLFGASDSYKEDEILQGTIAFNHFGKGLVQRMPRCRYGFVHCVNNDYTHWIMYAIGGSAKPTILSQGNRFNAPPNPAAKEVTKREYASKSEWKNWVWKSEGDEMLNGAFFVQSGDPNHKFPFGDNFVKPMPGSAVAKLTRFAGHLNCIPGKPC